MFFKVVASLVLGSLLIFASCTNENNETKFPLPKPDPCDSVKYSKHVFPIIVVNCANSGGCHGAGAANGDFTTYASTVQYITNGQIRDHVLVIKDMPKGGTALTETELNYFKCWLDNGGLNN